MAIFPYDAITWDKVALGVTKNAGFPAFLVTAFWFVKIKKT
jgi:hypothetical protein